MKLILMICILIVSTECGLLDDVLSPKDRLQVKDLFNQKPKNAPDSNGTEYHQGVLVKVVDTLKNGTKVIIDALGNIIYIHPNDNDGTSKTKITLENTTKSSIKDTEVVKNDEASKSSDPTSELAKEKVKVAPKNLTNNTNQTSPKTPDEKLKLNDTNNIVSGEDKEIKGTNDVNSDIKNSTETGIVKSQNFKDTKNSTIANKNPSGNEQLRGGKAFMKGDECPSGKSRADDGSCVEEVV